jgi:DNA-binding transcriptional regulator YiaG
MSQAFMKKPRAGASLRGSRTAHTVLLRMAADEARAQRIRDLREQTELKWRELAQYVGVSERSAHQWGSTGAISQPNAMKLAELFRKHGADIEPDYIWRGKRPSAPNLMNVLSNNESQLDRIEAEQQALNAKLDRILENFSEEAVNASLAGLRGQLAAVTKLLESTRLDQAALGEEVRQQFEAVTSSLDRLQGRRPA